jgi:hypothetical protein
MSILDWTTGIPTNTVSNPYTTIAVGNSFVIKRFSSGVNGQWQSDGTISLWASQVNGQNGGYDGNISTNRNLLPDPLAEVYNYLLQNGDGTNPLFYVAGDPGFDSTGNRQNWITYQGFKSPNDPKYGGFVYASYFPNSDPVNSIYDVTSSRRVYVSDDPALININRVLPSDGEYYRFTLTYSASTDRNYWAVTIYKTREMALNMATGTTTDLIPWNLPWTTPISGGIPTNFISAADINVQNRIINTSFRKLFYGPTVKNKYLYGRVKLGYAGIEPQPIDDIRIVDIQVANSGNYTSSGLTYVSATQYATSSATYPPVNLNSNSTVYQFGTNRGISASFVIPTGQLNLSTGTPSQGAKTSRIHLYDNSSNYTSPSTATTIFTTNNVQNYVGGDYVYFKIQIIENPNNSTILAYNTFDTNIIQTTGFFDLSYDSGLNGTSGTFFGPSGPSGGGGGDAACFSFKLLKQLKPRHPVIILKMKRNNKKMYRVNGYELTYDHPIIYKGHFMKWGYYALLNNGVEIPNDEIKYVYNIVGYSDQFHKLNKFILDDNITIIGAFLSDQLKINLSKKMKVLSNLVSNNIPIQIDKYIKNDFEDESDSEPDYYENNNIKTIVFTKNI